MSWFDSALDFVAEQGSRLGQTAAAGFASGVGLFAGLTAGQALVNVVHGWFEDDPPADPPKAVPAVAVPAVTPVAAVEPPPAPTLTSDIEAASRLMSRLQDGSIDPTTREAVMGGLLEFLRETGAVGLVPPAGTAADQTVAAVKRAARPRKKPVPAEMPVEVPAES